MFLLPPDLPCPVMYCSPGRLGDGCLLPKTSLVLPSSLHPPSSSACLAVKLVLAGTASVSPSARRSLSLPLSQRQLVLPAKQKKQPTERRLQRASAPEARSSFKRKSCWVSNLLIIRNTFLELSELWLSSEMYWSKRIQAGSRYTTSLCSRAWRASWKGRQKEVQLHRAHRRCPSLA